MPEFSNPFIKVQLQRNWRFWVGITLSLATLLWLILATNWTAAWQAIAGTNYWMVMAALIVNLTTIPLRSLRWRFLFPPQKPPPMDRLTAAMLIGQTVNLIAPARLGDLVRASLVRDHSAAFVLGTQVLQTTLDLLMLALLVIVMLFQVSLPDWWRGSGEALLWTTLLALFLLFLLVIFRRSFSRILKKITLGKSHFRSTRFLQLGEHFLQSLDTITRPILFSAALLLSAVIWLAYSITNFLLLRAIIPEGTFLAAIFVLIVLQLGVAVPSSPGRVGVFHYLGAQALLVFAIDEAPAVSFAILLHLISIVVPSAIGVFLAWRLDVDWSGSGLTKSNPL